MIFSGSKKRGKPAPGMLTEADIRNRLYGNAVATAQDIKEGPDEKTFKKHTNQDTGIITEFQPEAARIRQELLSLKKELEQAKNKLRRVQGVKAKKIRLLIAGSIILALILIVAAFLIKNIASNRHATEKAPTQAKIIPKKAERPLPVPKPIAKYTIQAAVYGNREDAQKFNAGLLSKGYKSFIHEARYPSGKDNFTIYIGAFDTKDEAEKTLDSIKKGEGIRDSFVITMPK